MMRRILLSLCVVLVVAAPAYANNGVKHGLRGMEGTVAFIADDSITVRRGGDELTCVRGKHSPAIDGIAVGDHVAVLCRQRRHHRRVLVRVKKLEDAARKGDAGQRFAIAGKITVVGDGAIAVHSDESGRTLTCRIPDRYAELARKLAVGDRVAMLCRGPQDGTPELVKLIRPEQNGGGKHEGDKPGLTDIAGHVTALGDGSIRIGNGTRTLACTVPDALAASVPALQVGDAAKMICRSGELVAIRKGDPPANPSAPKPEPHSFSFTGPVTLLSGDRVGVRVEGETRSCFVPADLRPQLSGFALEQPAALTCQGVDGTHGTLTAIAHAGA